METDTGKWSSYDSCFRATGSIIQCSVFAVELLCSDVPGSDSIGQQIGNSDSSNAWLQKLFSFLLAHIRTRQCVGKIKRPINVSKRKYIQGHLVVGCVLHIPPEMLNWRLV